MKRVLPLITVFLVILIADNSCSREYSFEKAAGTLKDSQDICHPVEISGHYQKGKSLAADSFYVTVEVNVTKIGAYLIQTDVSNGFSFGTSGIFTKKGLQKVKLKADGNPLSNIPTSFYCFFDSSICSFNITVSEISVPPVLPPAADTMAINTWWFRDSTDKTFHHGIIDPLSTWLKTGPNGNYLNIMGWPSVSTGFTYDTLFNVAMYLPNPSIDTGTYSISSGVGADHVFLYANNTGNGQFSFFYYYHSTKYTTPDFIFRILSYDSQTKTFKGTINGTSDRRKDYSNGTTAPHKISGMFYVKL